MPLIQQINLNLDGRLLWLPILVDGLVPQPRAAEQEVAPIISTTAFWTALILAAFKASSGLAPVPLPE